ncbi:MAG TPA: aldo/keto reductase, partial [Burkholderiaceae bacterium]|nr:aldo/keto reductase [Burkholderiaceae bacterium]
MEHVTLGRGGPAVSRVGLGTMTFGEQVSRDDAFAILDRALDRGVTLIDTAEMYPVPARAETFTTTETILGEWFAARPGARQRVVLATKVAGPGRGMKWVRGGAGDLTPADITAACEASLRRLRTDVIDLYQIHWPNRNVASFGSVYFDPGKDAQQTSIHDQLQALTALVRAG